MTQSSSVREALRSSGSFRNSPWLRLGEWEVGLRGAFLFRGLNPTLRSSSRLVRPPYPASTQR